MYKSNNVFTNKKKNIELNLGCKEFPSLITEKKMEDETNVNNEFKKNISYVDKLNLIIEEKENEDILKPGWVKISIDKKNNKIDTLYNNSNLEIENKVNEMEEFKKNLIPMFERWENYKKNYIENNGEDDYYYHHRFPNYDYSYLYKNDEDDISDIEFELEEENYNVDFY